MNTIGIFSNNLNKDLSNIIEIKKFFENTNNYSDFTIFSNTSLGKKLFDISILLSFYVSFFDGSIVFLNIEDYTHYKDRIIGKPILYLDDTIINSIDRNIIKNCDTISKANNQLTLINNNELQQTI